MRGLFKQLCILKSIDKLELFLLHLANAILIFSLFVCFSRQFLLDLLLDTVLAIHLVHLALLLRLHPLALNHILHVLGTLFLGMSLLMVQLTEGFLLSLGL